MPAASSASSDPAAAYLALAKEINGGLKALEAAHPQAADPRGFAGGLAVLETEASKRLGALGLPSSRSGDVAGSQKGVSDTMTT